MAPMQDCPGEGADDRVVAPLLREGIWATDELVAAKPGERQFAKRRPHWVLTQHVRRYLGRRRLRPAASIVRDKCVKHT